jgi:hypothetical protein
LGWCKPYCCIVVRVGIVAGELRSGLLVFYQKGWVDGLAHFGAAQELLAPTASGTADGQQASEAGDLREAMSFHGISSDGITVLPTPSLCVPAHGQRPSDRAQDNGDGA